MLSNTFFGKAVVIAALFSFGAFCASGVQAIGVSIYNTAVFNPAPGGGFQLDGFGRGDTFKPDLTSTQEPPQSFASQAFFDVWNINVGNLLPGNYHFTSTVVLATGSVLFQNVAFNSYDEFGNRNTVLFDLSDDGKQATGSGSFSVVKPCPVQSCVWIDVFGTQDLSVTQTGYGGTIVTQVPEPASYALLLAGLAAGAGLSSRRQRR